MAKRKKITVWDQIELLEPDAPLNCILLPSAGIAELNACADEDGIDSVFIANGGELVRLGSGRGTLRAARWDDAQQCERFFVYWAGREWEVGLIFMPIDASSQPAMAQAFHILYDAAQMRTKVLAENLARFDATRNSGAGLAKELHSYGVGALAQRMKRIAAREAHLATRAPSHVSQLLAGSPSGRDLATRVIQLERIGKVKKYGEQVTVSFELHNSDAETTQVQFAFMVCAQGGREDLHQLAFEAIAKKLPPSQFKRLMALICYMGEGTSITLNDAGIKEAKNKVLRLLGTSAHSASKEQSDKIKEVIETMQTYSLRVLNKNPRSRDDGRPERIPLVVVTSYYADTPAGQIEGKRMALNPEIVNSMRDGKGIWIPPALFASDERAAGSTFLLGLSLIIRWQMHKEGWNRKGGERLDAVLDRSGLFSQWQEKIKERGLPGARLWLEGLLAGLRAIMHGGAAVDVIGDVAVSWSDEYPEHDDPAAHARLHFVAPAGWLDAVRKPGDTISAAQPLLPNLPSAV